MKDYYKILDVTPAMTRGAVKRKYKIQLFDLHKGKSELENRRKIVQLSGAYAVIKKRKKQYFRIYKVRVLDKKEKDDKRYLKFERKWISDIQSVEKEGMEEGLSYIEMSTGRLKRHFFFDRLISTVYNITDFFELTFGW